MTDRVQAWWDAVKHSDLIAGQWQDIRWDELPVEAKATIHVMFDDAIRLYLMVGFGKKK